MHGCMVEIQPGWIVEGVWAGDYSEGDFDCTDLVYGTGIRIRNDGACFVSSASGVDRLWRCQKGQTWFVSNSLPALLATAGFSLCDDYANYRQDLLTVEQLGITRYKRWLPAVPSEVGVVYFDNLVFDGQSLTMRSKPCVSPRIHDFEAYRTFLVHTATMLGRNLSDARRKFAITPLTGISRGYDSPAVSVLHCTPVAFSGHDH